MSEHNERQTSLMVREIDRFTAEFDSIPIKVSRLGAMITNLEQLLYSMEGISDEWKRAYLSHWGVLEDAYAYELDQGSRELSRSNSQLIITAIDSLRELVKHRAEFESWGISDLALAFDAG